ncbi:MAG: glycosyltransferase [Planctomycetota bacterium]|jgi:glycosyltransferase involved in cell wall biosynthesis
MKNSMRILFLIDKMTPGGTQRHLRRLIRGLASAGEGVELVCLEERGLWGEELAREGISVRALGVSRWFSRLGLTAFHQLIQHIREFSPDILHCLLFDANVLGPVAARLSGVRCRVVASRRDIGFWMRWHHGWILRVVHPWIDRYVANAKAVAEVRARTDHLSGAELFTVIPNAVEVARFQGGCPLRPELKIGADERVLICVARLRPEKGQRVAVEAVAELARRGRPVRLLLVGDGPERRSLESQIDSLGLTASVHLLGHREDVADCYATADIALLPSLSEGFPNAVLEAMAAGLPVIASDVGGMGEVIADGETGYLFPAGNAAALADGVERVQGEDRTALRSRLASRLQEAFLPESEQQAYHRLYQDLLGV